MKARTGIIVLIGICGVMAAGGMALRRAAVQRPSVSAHAPPSPEQIAPASTLLAPPAVPPVVLNEQFNARQQDGGSDFIRELDATRRDPARSGIDRNYAVQHLSLAYETGGESAALVALVEAQDDADPQVADTAIFNLARLIHGKSVAADSPEAGSLHGHIRAALGDERKVGLRQGAIRAIALLKDKAYASRLAELAGVATDDVAVRVAALDALAAMRCTEYQQVAQAVLADPKAGAVLSAAARRLAALGG